MLNQSDGRHNRWRTVGYQIDLTINGTPAGSVCRDFGGDYPVSEMANVVCGGFIHAMENAEKAIQKMRKL